ncbi:MAG: V-type ATPase subunit [Firmicutes bacterium]|nr:V-type ATPase subunit [Bacillota bacterium]
MSKIKDKDYLALTAMLRAREAKMLDRDRVERMLSAGAGDAAKLLTDCGYEDMSAMTASEIDLALGEHKNKIIEELTRMCPEKELTDVFRIKYDYHNAKALVKAAKLGSDPVHILSNGGRVKAETLKEALETGSFRDIPVKLAKAMEEAQLALAKTGNSQAAEFIMDRAYHKELEETAGKQGGQFLKGYVKLLIDAANLGSAVRMMRMNKNPEFMMTALFEGGNVSAAAVCEAAAGGDALAELFRATPLAEAAILGAEAIRGGSMTRFELFCDNAVTSYLGKARFISFGAEAVVSYLARLESEITQIRMILTGKLAGIDPAVIRERLRDLYA